MKRAILPLIVLLVVCGFSVQQVLRYRARYYTEKRRHQLPWENKAVPYLSEVAEDIQKRQPGDTHELILATRKYVREAFVVKYDDWYRDHHYDLPTIMQTIYGHHRDPANNPLAHLDCQPACRTVACILHYLGLQTRLISFLSDEYDNVRSHACLEVYNPDTESWELHDVLYDLHFIEPQTGRVLTALDLVFGDLNRIVPTNGSEVGWVEASQRGDAAVLRDHYFEVLAFNHPIGKCFVLINTDRTSLTKTFPEDNHENMLEFLDRAFQSPPVLGFPDGHYQTFPLLRREGSSADVR